MRINSKLTIDDSELGFAASRSSGPGGQNVNKVNSRVTVTFDVGQSPSLNDYQRQRILSELSTRISKEGVLSVSSQKERSQVANRFAAEERMAELLREALEEQQKRRPTRTPRGVKERRLRNKKQRAEIKKSRAKTYHRD